MRKEHLMPKTVAFSLAGLTVTCPEGTPEGSIFSPQGMPVIGHPTGVDIISFSLRKADTTPAAPQPVESFFLYAPSLLVIWASAAKEENSTLIKGVLSDCSLSHFAQRLFKWRLLIERFRLGSDVESPAAQAILQKNKLECCMPAVNIGQWLDWLKTASRARQNSV